MSCPQAHRGLRTLVASDESFTTSISQQHLEFTQRYLSFFFMAMIGSPHVFGSNAKLRCAQTVCKIASNVLYGRVSESRVIKRMPRTRSRKHCSRPTEIWINFRGARASQPGFRASLSTKL